MDTHVGFTMLQNLGLAGGLAAGLALLGAILLHGVLLAVSEGVAQQALEPGQQLAVCCVQLTCSMPDGLHAWQTLVCGATQALACVAPQARACSWRK